MLQSIRTVFHLKPDIEFLLRSKLRQYMLLLRHGPEPFLISGNHIPGNIALHSRLITILKIDGQIHAPLFTVTVYHIFSRIEIDLINPQIVHTERLEHVVTPFLKLPDQITPF